MTATVIRLPVPAAIPLGYMPDGRAGPRPPALPRRLTPEERDRALHAELRCARIRIARLENELDGALRAGLAHLERARAAERRLSEMMAGNGAAG